MIATDPLPGPRFPSSRSATTAALALVVLAVVVYLPGTGGDFTFDDYNVIVSNEHLALDAFTPEALLDAAFSSSTGPLRRPVAMLSFALNRTATGLDPFPFKLTNVVIHATNAVLVLALAGLLAGALAPRTLQHPLRLACLVAALWAVHPLNLTSVLYVVQRMSSLCTTGMLVALLAWLVMRRRQIAGDGRTLLPGTVFVGASAAALLTKETAVLLPVYVAVIETFALRFREAPGLRRGFTAALLLAVLGVAALLVLSPATLLGGYETRPFTLPERILTEARVLVFYLGLLVFPEPAAFSLFHDDIALSRSLLDPPATAFALLVLAALGVLALVAARSGRAYVAFGIAWFFGGHLLESTVYPLEIAHEHRNYLPSVGILFVLVFGVAEAAVLLRARRAAVALAAGAVLALAALTALRADVWSDPVRLAVFEARHHPESARAVYELGRLQLESARRSGDPALHAAGIASMERAAVLAPVPTLPLTALLNAAAEAGDAVRRDALIARLLDEPRESVRVHAFRDVVGCQAWRGCAAAPEVVSRFAAEILGDARLSDGNRRDTAAWLAIYYLRVLSDADAALEILRSIAAEVPNDRRVQTRLAEALNAAGLPAESAALARRVHETLPWHSRMTDRVLRRRLESLFAATPDA